MKIVNILQLMVMCLALGMSCGPWWRLATSVIGCLCHCLQPVDGARAESCFVNSVLNAYRTVDTAQITADGQCNINSMVLNLLKLSDVPAIGKHNGTFTGIKKASGRDTEGNEFNHLIVGVELETTDSKGVKYRMEKTYNLDGRGLPAFRNDYRSWSATKLSDKDLAAFDGDKLMQGKPAIVVVKHGKDGKQTVARIDTFLPVPSNAQGNC